MKCFKIQQQLFNHQPNETNKIRKQDIISSQLIVERANEIQAPSMESNLRIVNQELIPDFSNSYTQIRKRSNESMNSYTQSHTHIKQGLAQLLEEQPKNPLQKLKKKNRSSNSVTYSSKRPELILNQAENQVVKNNKNCQLCGYVKDDPPNPHEKYQLQIKMLQEQNKILTQENYDLKQQLEDDEEFYKTKITKMQKELTDLETILKNTLLQQSKMKFYQTNQNSYNDSQKTSIFEDKNFDQQRYKTSMESDEKENLNMSSSFLSQKDQGRVKRKLINSISRPAVVPQELRCQSNQIHRSYNQSSKLQQPVFRNRVND